MTIANKFSLVALGVALFCALSVGLTLNAQTETGGDDVDGGETVPSASINASPSTITQGSATLLTWSSGTYSECFVNQGVGNVTVPGSRSVSPESTITYSIVCAEDGVIVSDDVTVTVNPPPPPTATLTASPTRTTGGNSATLTYRCTDSTSGSINQGIGSITTDGSSHTVSTGALEETTQYTLTCTGSAGTAQAYATVAVLSAEISASPTSITAGMSTTISWRSTGAVSCTSDQFNSWGNTSGVVSVSPTETTTYSITCSRPGAATNGNWVTDQEWNDSWGSGDDLTCPITNERLNRYFRGIPRCTTSELNGGPCDGSKPICVRMTSEIQNGSSGCFARAAHYRCEGTGTGAAETITRSVTVTVSDTASGIDLTAGAVSPAYAEPGVPQTFFVTITNQGQDGTETGFPVLFQRATSDLGENIQDQGYVDALSLEGGAYRGASKSITLAEGTWYLRACADKYKGADADGEIPETSENNNCGEWTRIDMGGDPEVCPTCDPGGSGSSVSCAVSDDEVLPGESVTYTATPKGSAGAPYSWDASHGEVGFGEAATATRTFTKTGSYTMAVSATGANKAGQCPVVEVDLCPGTPTVDLTADAQRVNAGDSTTLRWTQIANVSDKCSVVREGAPGALYEADASSCVVPGGSVGSGAINTQTTFSIVCDGAVRDSVIVNIIPAIVEF